MSSVNSYLFHNTSRIGSDMTDQTQKNVHNTRFANHTLSNYYSKGARKQLNFLGRGDIHVINHELGFVVYNRTSQPNSMRNATEVHGRLLNGEVNVLVGSVLAKIIG